MEEKIVELLKLANDINIKQENVYLRIEYTADETKRLEISVINKKTFALVEKMNIMLIFEPVEKLDIIIKFISKYAGDIDNK